MSLILEALAKSEAERRRGQSPDLFTPMPQPTPPQAPRRTGLLIGALLLVVTLIAGGWWFYSARSEPQTPPVVQTESLTAPTANPPQINAPVASNSEQTAPPVAVGPASAAAPPPIASVPAPAVPAPITAPPVNLPAPVTEPNPAPSTPIATVPAPPTPAPELLAPSEETVPTDTKSTDPEPIVETSNRPQPLSVLGSAVQGLPPMKISVYVWAENAQRRFIVMDGERTTEGGRIGDQIVLSRIEKEGFVINWQGREYWVDRP